MEFSFLQNYGADPAAVKFREEDGTVWIENLFGLMGGDNGRNPALA
jgi:hypothetical protein